MTASERATPATARRSPREPDAAAAFIGSLLVPGAGHFAAGALGRACAAFATFVLALGVAVLFFRLDTGSPWPTAFGVWLPLAVQVGAGADAARTAEARRRSGAPARGLLGFALWCAAAVLALELLVSWVRSAVIEPMRIPSEAMLPTLVIGDQFWVDRRAYLDAPPARGDVVAFLVARDDDGGVYPVDVRPELPRDRFVKRVVGVPGDTVEIRDGVLWLNGASVATEPTAQRSEALDGATLAVAIERLDARTHEIAHDADRPPFDAPPHLVEPDRYYLLGDARERSNDSRVWGTVHRDHVQGRASHLYWSAPPDENAVRWERIGRSIQ